VVWRSWWLGDVAGGVVVVPLALAWAQPPARDWRGRMLEGVLMLATVGALSAIALSAKQPLTYLVFPGLIWAALRFGPQGATLAVAVAAVQAVVVTANNLGPFHVQAPNNPRRPSTSPVLKRSKTPQNTLATELDARFGLTTTTDPWSCTSQTTGEDSIPIARLNAADCRTYVTASRTSAEESTSPLSRAAARS
jgi:hypothetical protein